MKKLFKMFAVLVALAAFVTACQPDTPETPKEYALEVTSETTMEFPAEGGEGVIAWKLNEMTRNKLKPEPTLECEAEWIVTSLRHVGAFEVHPNDGAPREAVIKVTYAEQVIEVTVKQAGAGELPQPEASFDIDVQEVHAASAITQVTPSDSEMYYVMFLEDVSYFQNGGIDTQELLWEDDFAAFERNAINNSMNLKDFMIQANVAFQGVKRVKWNDVLPGVKSVLYVYGVKFAEDGASYEPITDVVWEVIEPEYAPLQDVAFDLDIDIDGAEVELSVKPENWDGHYLVKFVDANSDLYLGNDAEIGLDFMKSICDEWIAVCNSNLSGGHEIEHILDEIAYKGNKTIAAQLSSYTLYSALVFPVAEYDGFVQVVAKPSFINFSTEEVQQSDMDINIEVSNCYVRVADLKITPSNPDETYLLLITPTEYLPADYDDEVLLDKALGEFIYYTYEFKGEVTTHLNTLYPNKEYIVVAFGYSGGVVTTDVCTKVFKTEPEGECELTVTDVVVTGPYKPSDLYAYDPERFKYYAPNYTPDSAIGVITIEVKTSEPTGDIFAYPFPQMDYDWAGHETIFYDLLIDTCEPLAMYDIIYDYAPYYVCAAAFDYKGNVTPMWMSDLYYWTTKDARPIEELIEKLDAGSAQLMMVDVTKHSIKPAL